MYESANVAFMTSVYARSSDWFIRGEVSQMRALGYSVDTYSIRRPEASELVSEEIRHEHAATEYLLDGGVARLATAWFRFVIREPRRAWQAARLAIRIGTPGLKGRLWPVAYLFEAAYLAERLRARGTRHLHNHIAEGSASVAMLASVLADIPFSMTIHGPSEFDRPTLIAIQEKVRRAAFTVSVSEFGRSQLYRWSDPADWSRIHVVRCGLHRSFLEHGLTPIPEERRFVCVGRLAEQKGLLLLVEAVRRLAAEGLVFELALIGDGPLRATIEALIERLRLENHIRLLGALGAESVREEILRSRVMVLPSFAEGLPMVLMESLALGRPVISTYVAGIPELVTPGVSGWLVPAGSIDRLTEAMREALSACSHDLEAMGKAGAARVAIQHDGANEAAKLARLIERSCPGRAKNRLDVNTDDLKQYDVWDDAKFHAHSGQPV